MRVAIDLPQDVFDAIVKEKGSVKEVVEKIVIKAVRGGNNKLRELEEENKKLKEKLRKIESKDKVDYNLIENIIRNSFQNILNKSPKPQATFAEKCLNAVITVNKYLDSIDEPIRLKMYAQNGELILCEPKIIANFLDHYAIHSEKLKSLAKLIKEIDPEIEVKVIEPDMCKGYILLQYNANILREVRDATI